MGWRLVRVHVRRSGSCACAWSVLGLSRKRQQILRSADVFVCAPKL